MGKEELKQELLKALSDGVVEYDEDLVKQTAQKVVDEDLDAYEAIMDGLAAGMELVGELYDEQEYFVPEMLLCAEAFYAGLNMLRPHVKSVDHEAGAKWRVVIGTVEGDVHDIGKNIIKLMFEVAGFTVHDLGADVPLQRFVEEQARTDSEIVALSAMMTTTLMAMKKVIEMIKTKNPNVGILVGGAPLTRDTADLFGADGYADSAGNAVQEVIRMVGRFRKMRNPQNFPEH